MPIITRRFEFDAGHRVLGHEGKCKNLHGHRYVAEVTVKSSELDSLGRVIDFGVIKAIIGGWIDCEWDHNFLCHSEDPLLKHSMDGAAIFAGKKPFIFTNRNPTAENIAEELFSISEHLLFEHPLIVTKVKVWETPNCAAEYPE